MSTSRTAVVTGGVSGIGAAAAARLAADDVKVITLDLADGADLNVDVTDAGAVRAAAERIGPVDILINSAGIVGPSAPLWEIPLDGWNRTFNVNVNGTLHTCQAFVPGMRERGWGRIVNIASMAGKDGNPNMSPYSASKAAVIALTKSLGKELANLDIAVNTITPAAARTRIFDQMSQEHIDFMLSKIPRNRFVEPREIAAMVAWLCSAENSFTTGAVFDLSGGRATY
jgi:2-dehydro-3-deoxy-L-rhamnonate dehydrogenase (NAD+)